MNKQITPEQIADFARKEANRSRFLSSYPFNPTSVEHGAIKGAEWAIKELEPKWIPVSEELPGDEQYALIWRKGYSPEQTVARQVFDMTHAVYCFIDNSMNKYAIGDTVSHWSPLLDKPSPEKGEPGNG